MLDGFIKIEDLVKKLSLYGYGACTITDHGNMSGSVEFNTELNKAGIKPIIGNELYISMGPASFQDKTNNNYHMVCLAKNKDGYKTLCKITSESNKKENFYRKPRVDLNILEQYNDGNLIFLTGHHGSLLYKVITNDDGSLKSDALNIGVSFARQLKSRLSTVFIESQRICTNKEYCDLMNEIAKQADLKVIACIDAHYIDRSDALYQRLLLCSSLGLKMTEVKDKAGGLLSFFQDDHYHIVTPQELSIYNQDELNGIHELGEMCSSYSLKENPTLPRFGEDEEAQLKQLCRDGWNRIIIPNKIDQNTTQREIYAKRVLDELDVISTYNLSGYFLIVQDFIKWLRNQGILCNFGRGSASGSLVSYLTGITMVDPIPHNLLFSRFLNKGRFTKDKFEYPDIDVDLPTYMREPVMHYLKEKYGSENVGQVATFGRLQGAGALKEILRVLNVCSPQEADLITKDIPQHGGIADQLEAQRETSILRFTLNNFPNLLHEYVKLENGSLVGDYAEYFKLAISIEGSIKTQGIHAAGVIISPTPLEDICPMLPNNVCGLEMDALKIRGLTKFDLLGVAAYDKLGNVNKMLRQNYV